MQNGNPGEIRRKKIIALVSVLIIAVLLIVFVLIPSLVKNNQAKANYSKALELMNSGQYQAAAEYFEECGDYSDAQDLAYQSYYTQAERLFENNDYEQAAGFYQRAGSYSNASEQYSECMYQIGLARMGRGDSNGAADAFLSAGINYKDIKRYICSDAALSQAVSLSTYPLNSRIEDYLFYKYGKQVVSISGDGNIDGDIYGDYSLDGTNLEVHLCADEYNGGTMDQVVDAFLSFIRCVYGIENSSVTSKLSEIKQNNYGSFYLSEQDELMADTWNEAGYVFLKVETVPIETTRQKSSLEGKAQMLVNVINQTAGENVATIEFVNNDTEATIEIKLLFSDDGSCYITGSYDASNDVFSISTLSIGFDVGPEQTKSEYIATFSNAAPVVYGIVEGVFGMSIDSSAKNDLVDKLTWAAEVWYRLVVEEGKDMWMEETGIFSPNLAGLRFEFQVVGNWFGGTLECSGYSF